MTSASTDPAQVSRAPETLRLRRTHLAGARPELGMPVRQADRQLHLDGGSGGLLDTTHFDTVRFPPPAWASTDISRIVHDGSVAYTPYRGHPEVLADLSESLSSFLGVPLSTDDIAITAGTQAGLFATLSSLVDEGDLVLLADPDYLFCERILAFLGARVERIPVLYAEGPPTLDTAAIRRLLPEQPRLLIFSHPNNPTGAIYSPATIQEIARIARDADLYVLVDELYSRLVYNDTPFTHLIAEPGMRQRCITLLGPSKTESMSGFRIGIVTGPPAVMESVEQCIALTSLRAPGYAQQLLRKWLTHDHDFLTTRITDLHTLQDMTITRLTQIPGLHLTPQQGTAYVFPDVTELGATDIQIATLLQQHAGVIVSPGYQFGPRGHGHFRTCYARNETEWSQALDRIVHTLTTLTT